MARQSVASIPAEIRDKYYFIDYLRLHRFGKSNEIWKKNRNMLVKEHEYSDSSETRARKGYKSYIQRCMKSILDHMYPDFDIIKPRNIFGYEIGQKNDDTKDLLDLRKNEDRIKLILSRYILNNEYRNETIEYRDSVLSSSRVNFKNREAGLQIRLDEMRSFGYSAIKDLTGIREKQNALISLTEDLNPILINILIEGIVKAYRVPTGGRVEKLESSRPSGIFGTVVNSQTNSNYRGTYINYEIQWDNRMGEGTSRTYSDQIKPVLGALDESAEREIASVSPILDRIIDYANVNFGGTQGLDRATIYNLARGAVVREILADGDIHTAGIARQMDSSSDILERIDLANEYEYQEEDDDWTDIEEEEEDIYEPDAESAPF